MNKIGATRARRGLGLRLSRLAPVCAVSLVTGIATADVTVEERIVVDGFGPARIGALEGTTSTAIAGEKARVDSSIQFKSRVLRAFAGGNQPTVQIIRLDEERMLDLEPARKQYRETTFQAFRDVASRAMTDAAAAGEPGADATPQTAPSGAPIDESQCAWSPARSEVKRTGERAQLAGMDTERTVIQVSQTCTDRQTGAACDFVYSIDQWLAAELPGGSEARQFWTAYAEKLALGDMVSGMQSRAQQVFARYKDGWGEALKSAGTLEGYPLRTTFVMQVGGASCAQTEGVGVTAGQQSGAVPTAGQAATEAGTQAAASAATTVAAQEAAEAAGSSVAGGIAGSAAGAFGGSLASGLLNRMRNRRAESAPPAEAAAAPAEPGMVQLFRMSSETTAIRSAPVAATAFDIPADYRKVE